jgi:predicted ATPase
LISSQYAIDVRLKRDEVPSFDEYPFSLAAVRALDVLPLHARVTCFVGENGSGKSNPRRMLDLLLAPDDVR